MIAFFNHYSSILQKQIVISLLFIFCISALHAQSETKFRHEFDISLAAIHEGGWGEYRWVVQPGLTYKYHLRGFNLRFGASFYEYEPYSWFEDHSHSKNLVVNAGIEKLYFKGWFKLITAAEIESKNEFYKDVDTFNDTIRNYFSPEAGLAFSLGFNISFSKNLSLTTETSLFVSKEIDSPYIDVSYSPIQIISLNCHF